MNPKKLIVVIAAAALACSGQSRTSLSLSAKAVTTAANPAATSLDLGNGISIDQVKVVIRKLKLEGTPATATADAGSTDSSASSSDAGADDGKTEVENEEDKSDEVVLKPFLISLSGSDLTGGVQKIIDAAAPTGTFRELKFAIGPVTADQAGSDAGLADLAAKKASVVIDGTLNGVAFSYVTDLTAQVQMEREVDVAGDKSNNVTLSIDPKGWFGAGATPLDPSDAANKAAIDANIKASFDAFQDDSRSGHHDHEDGGADGGSGSQG